MLRHTFLTLILAVCLPLPGAEWRQYTSRNGLVTQEVHQIAELPNGQLLVNCEGVFCLFNGRRFEILPCDRRRVMPLPHFAEGYAHLWQGDSLLWLRDFHKLYLFDTRSRTFRYDWKQRIADREIQQLVSGATGAETLPSDVDSVMKACGSPHRTWPQPASRTGRAAHGSAPASTGSSTCRAATPSRHRHRWTTVNGENPCK